jgi:hypothetical protein
MRYAEGVHLTRTDENVAEIDALAERFGGRVVMPELLDDLDRRGRRSLMRARAVRRAYTFDAVDRRDPRWWPQGVTTSADASDSGEVEGRRLLVVAWYAKQLPGDEVGQGSRVTFFDLDRRRYQHVLLVRPVTRDGAVTFEPLSVHAGGIVWHGPYLHVAATARGFHTCRVDDLLRVAADEPTAYGYRYVLPVRFSYKAETDDGHERLRYSFLSLDRSASPPEILAGEYGRGTAVSRRLAHFPVDPETLLLATEEDGLARPTMLDEGVGQMQGAVVARGRYHLTVSKGPWTFGSVYTGRPGAFRRHRWATPMGPEDIAYWPGTDELWSVTEHPRRRWIVAMRRGWFD